MSEHLHMSVTKPIGTVQDDAVLLASLFLPAVSVVFLCPGCNPQHCPWGEAGDANSSQTAGCCWREQQVTLSLLSHWLRHDTLQQYHNIRGDVKHWGLLGNKNTSLRESD